MTLPLWLRRFRNAKAEFDFELKINGPWRVPKPLWYAAQDTFPQIGNDQRVNAHRGIQELIANATWAYGWGLRLRLIVLCCTIASRLAFQPKDYLPWSNHGHPRFDADESGPERGDEQGAGDGACSPPPPRHPHHAPDLN